MVQARASLTSGESTERRKIINRLRRLEGQVRGLQSMVAAGQECEPVLTQIMAAKSALNQVGTHIVGHAMKRCLIEEETTDRDALVDSAFQVFLRYRRLASDASPSELDAPPATPEAICARLRDLEADLQEIRLALEVADADCEAVITQVAGATATINEVALSVLGHSMRKCLIPAAVTGRDELIDEAVAVFLRYSSCVK